MKNKKARMTKVSKKLLALCLCFVFLLTAFPLGSYLVSAEGEDSSTTTETTTTAVADPTNTEETTTPDASSDAEDESGISAQSDEDENASATAPVTTSENIDFTDGDVVEALENTDIGVKVNSVDLGTTVSIKPGKTSANAAEATSGITSQIGSAQYLKTVIVYSNGTTADVVRVGNYNGTTYYALDEYDDTGVKLESGESLYLVYADVLNVTYNALPSADKGTVTGAGTVNRGETLKIQMSPATDYKVGSVTYTVNGTQYTATVSDNEVAIDTTSLTGDITVDVTFAAISAYTLKPASSMWTSTSSSADWEDNGHGGMASNRFGLASQLNSTGDTFTYLFKTHYRNRLYDTQGVLCDISDTSKFPNIYTATDNSTKKFDASKGVSLLSEYYYRVSTLEPSYGSTMRYVYNWQMCDVSVTPGSDGQFLLYSQDYKNGGTTWVLTTLTIGGEDINVPTLNVGDSATTTMKDGTEVTVQYVLKDEGLYWHDADVTWGDYHVKSWDKYRSFYLVTVKNVHKDMDVEWYFQDSSAQRITVVGRNGIAKTAVSQQYAYKQVSLIEGSWANAGTHYYYQAVDYNTGDEDDRENVFVADNTSDSNNQLLLYACKPGYNPYTITALESSDGSEYTDNFRYTNVTGTVEDVIYNAGGRFNTRFRHWGRSTTLKYGQDNIYTFKGNPFNTSDTSTAITGSTNKSVFTYISIGSWGGQTEQLLLTQLEEDSTYNNYKWYALALNTASGVATQKIKLNATPYQYHAEYYLNGGTLEDTSDLTSNFSINDEGTAIVDSSIKTVESDEPYFTTPIGVPTKTGYIFQGWQLMKKDVETVTVYKASDGRYYTATYDEDNDTYNKTYYDDLAAVLAGPVMDEATTMTSAGWTLKDISDPVTKPYQAEEDDDTSETNRITDDALVYTLTFSQPIDKLYGENDQFSLTDDTSILQYAFGDEKTDEDMYFTFEAKWTAVSSSSNTLVNYAVYCQVPDGSTGTTTQPTVKANGRTYQQVYNTNETQLVGETVVLNQYKPVGASYYYYNTEDSKIATTTTALNEDGSIPESNKLYVYYDYQSQDLNISETTTGDAADLEKSFNITVTFTADSDNPMAIPEEGKTYVINGYTFTSDGTKLVGKVPVKNGETAELTNVPYGWSYTVEETSEDAGNYEVTYSGDATSGTLGANEVNISITNDYQIPPTTGISSGTKFNFKALLLGAVELAAVGYIGYAYFKKGKENSAQN